MSQYWDTVTECKISNHKRQKTEDTKGKENYGLGKFPMFSDKIRTVSQLCPAHYLVKQLLKNRLFQSDGVNFHIYGISTFMEFHHLWETVNVRNIKLKSPSSSGGELKLQICWASNTKAWQPVCMASYTRMTVISKNTKNKPRF